VTTEKPAMTTLDPPEKKRTYHFAQRSFVLENVVALCVRPSGTHRLETADGRKWIVPTGWLVIELEVEAWTL
jgi:hypothetical protein